MKRLIIFVILSFLISCKKNNVKDNTLKRKPYAITEPVKKVYNWHFLKIYTLDNSSNEELTNDKFKDIKIRIVKDSIFLKNIGFEVIYKGEVETKKYFNRIYSYEHIKSLLKEKHNLSVDNSVLYIRNKNAHKKNSILKKYFGDAFIIGNLLFIVNDENFVVFEKGNIKSTNKDTITSNYKINNLPISYNYENDFMQIQLPVAWASFKKNTSFEDTFIALLPKIKEYQPVIFTGIYAFGNSDEYLIVLNKNYKEISRIKLYYNDALDGNVENYSYSTYQIEKNYTTKITTYKVKADLENNKIIEKKSSDTYYTISNNGMIIKNKDQKLK